MPRFQITKYNPAADSSSTLSDRYYTANGDSSANRGDFRRGDGQVAEVFLDWSTDDNGKRTCPCGCRESLARTARFRIGHDARLLGILKRAHITGTKVTIVKDAATTTENAIDVAATFSTDRHDWVAELNHSAERHAATNRKKIEAANDEVREEARGPQPGNRRLIKVGRWNYTGEIVAVYQEDGDALFKYTTAGGDVREIRRALSETADV